MDDIKKKLLDLFTKDTFYLYHLIKTDNPEGHLVYIMRSDSEFDTDSLEFTTTKIAEELANEYNIKLEKFAPGVYFSEEKDTSELNLNLNLKFFENANFSNFIESIKDKYRILEINDSLLYKFDPEKYEDARRKEHEEKQKDLIEELLNQIENQTKKRKEHLLSYENNLVKLLKDYLEEVIEFEKRDFDFEKEFYKLITSLVDKNYAHKRIKICSFEESVINVLLSDEILHTATFKLEGNKVIVENLLEIKNEQSVLTDYEILSKLYDVDINTIDWETKSETERLNYVIDYLVPIFENKKKEKEEDWFNKMKNSEEFKNENFDDEEFKDEDDGYKKISYANSTPENFYFDVYIDNESGSMVALVEQNFWEENHCLDDQLGSHNLPKNIQRSLINAGVYGWSEEMESMWGVMDNNRTKEDIIESMTKEGFKWIKI